MQKLYSAGSLAEAHLLLHRLAAAGIAARVLNEYAQGAMGEIPFTNAYPEVWIEEARDEQRAREVLRRFLAEAAGEGEPRACPACGEENPGAFELCWRCQTPLP